jgi:hypothetical protein
METATATVTKPVMQPKQLPAPNSDFYQLADVLTDEEKALVKKVRRFGGPSAGVGRCRNASPRASRS